MACDYFLSLCTVELPNNKELKASEANKDTPKVTYHEDYLQCVCGCEGEHSYAISTENGKIVEKGSFHDGFRISLSDFDKGYYHLTLFDAMKRDVFAFQVK